MSPPLANRSEQKTNTTTGRSSRQQVPGVQPVAAARVPVVAVVPALEMVEVDEMLRRLARAQVLVALALSGETKATAAPATNAMQGGGGDEEGDYAVPVDEMQDEDAKGEDSKTTCAVCQVVKLQKYEEGEDSLAGCESAASGSCGHRMHMHCILSWCRTRTTCPVASCEEEWEWM